MRVQRPIWPLKRVASVSLRVSVRSIPAGAAVEVTDIQLQAGKLSTGPAPSPSELVPVPAGKQYRNGVIHDGMEVVALSNGDRAAPVSVKVGGRGKMQVGSFRFGEVIGSAEVDGRAGTATQGWGRAPLITERSDLVLQCALADRAHLTLEWEEMGD